MRAAQHSSRDVVIEVSVYAVVVWWAVHDVFVFACCFIIIGVGIDHHMHNCRHHNIRHIARSFVLWVHRSTA